MLNPINIKKIPKSLSKSFQSIVRTLKTDPKLLTEIILNLIRVFL